MPPQRVTRANCKLPDHLTRRSEKGLGGWPWTRVPQYLLVFHVFKETGDGRIIHANHANKFLERATHDREGANRRRCFLT